MDILQNFAQKWQMKENKQTQEMYAISSCHRFYKTG